MHLRSNPTQNSDLRSSRARLRDASTYIRTDESTRALLRELDAEGAGHLGLVAVALDGDVALLVELGVGAAVVLALGVGVAAALVALDGVAA